MIGVIVLIMIVLYLFETYGKQFLERVYDFGLFYWGVGLLMGVFIMMANAVGFIYFVYVFVCRMFKTDFFGIGVRYYLFVNLVKVLFMIEFDIINRNFLMFNVVFLFGVFVGVFLGCVLIVKVF